MKGEKGATLGTEADRADSQRAAGGVRVGRWGLSRAPWPTPPLRLSPL